MPYKPQAEPGRTDYQADVQITRLGEKIGDPVAAAEFPDHILRFRNDRWDKSVGLDRLDEQQWIAHFGKFQPLPDNLDPPLALRYHGHQFRHYNPDIGDGRGFLFAQLRDHEARLMDLGTKGSGTTPWSRTGDGRLTLKGAVREILATEMLEALGVNTSKTFSVVETGEKLMRGDEPSPTRSAVMTRLSHSHIRIGAFQRIAYEQNEPLMRQLVDYCLENYYGGSRTADPATELFARTTGEVARLTAAYMTAGFVHGVLNTDNINITGESFDYGPWRFTPFWEPGFTAAYFDHEGLYCFGRQPEALHWNLAQFASALRLIADSDPLVATLESFPKAYGTAFTEHFCWRLGVMSEGFEPDRDLVVAAEKGLAQKTVQIDRFFFDWGKCENLVRPDDDSPEFSEFRALIADRTRIRQPVSDYWRNAAPCSMHIEEVESIWDAIASDDNWSPLSKKVNDIREMGAALRTG
ncbi:protein adenylyltransferase SelO family protein [Sphingorhabdus sp. SMR4y]|uniref:protein adenylyltransferase SelO family protein n=1 Tax=Sphingorhabdus sp. SMR4y TaxID=2584094 RepID=UPI000B5CF4A4|nr:YdiU family protein [Sphingorhabdus sp. SMR4y]ASK87450.1 selenoprotein O and cysteine protein [Sphingorhabdus sp. SMR4y]